MGRKNDECLPNSFPFIVWANAFSILCAPLWTRNIQVSVLEKKNWMLWAAFYRVSSLRVHEGTLQACFPQASEFPLRMVSGTCFLPVAPRGSTVGLGAQGPSACAGNLQRSSRSLAGQLFPQPVSQPQSALEEFKPTLAHLKPQVPVLHTHLWGRQAGRWVREVLRGPLCSGITGWTW